MARGRKKNLPEKVRIVNERLDLLSDFCIVNDYNREIYRKYFDDEIEASCDDADKTAERLSRNIIMGEVRCG